MAVEPIPFGDQIENAILNFNKAASKRVAADTSSKIFKMLSVGTEPFFRCDLGERHLSPASVANGYLLWGLSGILSCFTGTLMSPLCSALGFYSMAGYFYSVWIPLLVSVGVFITYWRCCTDNAKRLQEFREGGKTYHSKSRGKLRIPDPGQDLSARLFASVGLLLLAPVVGIAFIASLYVSANLAAQQQAALYDRYLDALDAQIEGEFLQDALLGKCPPEITFLYKPLPAKLNPELRESIAAAAVGKPVKVIAQSPRPISPKAA